VIFDTALQDLRVQRAKAAVNHALRVVFVGPEGKVSLTVAVGAAGRSQPIEVHDAGLLRVLEPYTEVAKF
jgi:hypothetical protein